MFEEYDAKEQARREAKRDREMREFRIAEMDARDEHKKPKPIDYFYTGDEIIQEPSSLAGKPFSDVFSHMCNSRLQALVTRYQMGQLVAGNAIDLARFIEQEYDSGQYNYC